MAVSSSLSADEQRKRFLSLSPTDFLRPARLQGIQLPWLARRGLELSILRLDELDPFVSGNKYFKVFNYLKSYLKQDAKVPIASFGGAWSNHLHALAATCEKLSIASIGVIRGHQQDNDCLRDLRAKGMRLHFVSRQAYRQRYQADYLASLEAELGEVFWVPEGGSGSTGALGCMAIGQMLANTKVDVVAIACGTGASMAGVSAGLQQLNPKARVLGFSALKGGLEDLTSSITKTIADLPVESPIANWSLNGDFHCGGFAKYPSYLSQWVEKFELATKIPLDPVYTSKMMYGLESLCDKACWPVGSRIAAIHTGGLQGRRGRQLSAS